MEQIWISQRKEREEKERKDRAKEERKEKERKERLEREEKERKERLEREEKEEKERKKKEKKQSVKSFFKFLSATIALAAGEYLRQNYDIKFINENEKILKKARISPQNEKTPSNQIDFIQDTTPIKQLKKFLGKNLTTSLNYICGPSGSGKSTYILKWLREQAIKKDKEGNFENIVFYLKVTGGPKKQQKEEELQRFSINVQNLPGAIRYLKHGCEVSQVNQKLHIKSRQIAQKKGESKKIILVIDDINVALKMDQSYRIDLLHPLFMMKQNRKAQIILISSDPSVKSQLYTPSVRGDKFKEIDLPNLQSRDMENLLKKLGLIDNENPLINQFGQFIKNNISNFRQFWNFLPLGQVQSLKEQKDPQKLKQRIRQKEDEQKKKIQAKINKIQISVSFPQCKSSSENLCIKILKEMCAGRQKSINLLALNKQLKILTKENIIYKMWFYSMTDANAFERFLNSQAGKEYQGQGMMSYIKKYLKYSNEIYECKQKWNH